MILDESQFPVVMLNMDEAADIDMTLQTLRELMKHRREKIVLLIDCTRGMKPKVAAAERKLATEFIESEKANMKRAFAGIATLHSSVMIRGIITAIRWVSPLPVEDEVFPNKDQALPWAQKLLRQNVASAAEAR